MFRWMIPGLALVLIGCGGGPQVRHYGEQYPPTLPGEVDVLYSFPDDREFTKVGSLDVKRYKPGFSDPTVADAREKLQEAGAELGAHAVVVVNWEAADRTLRVTGEAIRWPDSP